MHARVIVNNANVETVARLSSLLTNGFQKLMSDSLQRSAVKRGLSPVVMRDGHDEGVRQDDGWIPDVGGRERAGAVRSETHAAKDERARGARGKWSWKVDTAAPHMGILSPEATPEGERK